jgi:hypothetical protein
MPQHRFSLGTKLLITVAITSCSPMQKTKQFEPDSKWFKLNYPPAWQVELEDGIYTFTEAHDPSWAFQVSVYKATHDTIPDFNMSKELQRAVEGHPTAKIITLPTRKALYYTEHKGSHLLQIWIIGGKRCKAFCSYTADISALQNANFEAAQQAINTMTIQ